MKSKQAAILAIAGVAILLLACIILGFTPIRLQVNGWTVEVIRVIEATPTSAPVFTPTSASAPSASSVENTLAPDANAYIVTDRTWKFSRAPTAGWEQLNYDDSAWQSAEGNSPCNEIPGAIASCIWDYPYQYIRDATLYFRKTFDVSRLPPLAKIVIFTDDDVFVYLNGEQVFRDSFGGISWLEINVTGWLNTGANVLALRGLDTGEGSASVEAALGLCYDTQDYHTPQVSIMNHREDWFEGQVYIEAVDAPCDSGVAELAYRVDGGAWRVVQPHQLLSLPEGEHEVQARATDHAGRQGFDLWTFHVGPPPSTTATTIPVNGASEPQIEQARAFAEPILAAIAGRPPDFEEDFGDPNSGWIIANVEAEDHDGELGYADGEYFIVAPPASAAGQFRHGYLWTPIPEVRDFVLELDARFDLGEASDWQGSYFYVSFWWEGDNHDDLSLSPEGWANLARAFPSGENIVLADEANAPVRSQENNHLRIIARGPQMAIYLNEQPLFFIREETSVRGHFVLGVANRSQLPLRMWVDDIKIWNIADLP